MGLRRRRKKLTSLLYSYDKRIRATTLRQVKRQVVVPADAAEEEETTTPDEPEQGTEIGIEPPDQWARVIGGFYYPPSRTGGLGQVELFLNEDLQLSSGTTLYVSGTEVNWNQTSGGQTYTGSFRPNTSPNIETDPTPTQRVVFKYGNPSWTGRSTSTRPTYRSIPAGVTNTVLYTVPNKSEIPNIVTLTFRAQISSYFATTTTTGTINFASPHHFANNQILNISDLPEPFRGIDGIIKVSSVPSSTQISFTFSSPLAATIPTTTAPANSYVYAVVSKYTKIGSSWIDSSVTPNKVYIWDGLRWVGYTDALEDGLVTNDGIAPAPPTNLVLSSYGYARDGAKKDESRSAVELSWTAPTTNANGEDLTDLAGYRIWISTTSINGPWPQKRTFGQETTQTILNLSPDIMHYFSVIAYDTYGLESTALKGQIKTTLAPNAVNAPSTPIIKSNKLGVVVLQWDGKDSSGLLIPPKLLEYIEVHGSTTSGFTPSDTTLLGEIFLKDGLYAASDLLYNTDYYFKFVAVDIHNKKSNASAQVTAKVKPLVDADLIAASLNSPLSVWPFANGSVTAGALAAGAINAANVFGPNVVTQSAISANAIGATQIAANAVTAGAIQANAITSAKISALAVTADKIATNAITADKINAGSVTAEKISSSYIYGNNITGDQVVAGTITATSIDMTQSQYAIKVGTSSSFAYFRVNPGGVNGVALNAVGFIGPDTSGVISNWFPYEDDNVACGLPLYRWTRLYAVNTTVSSSDVRKKTDIQDASLGLDFIKKLRPVSYKFIVGGTEYVYDENGDRIFGEDGKPITTNKPGVRRHWGLIAQEVKQALDDLNAPDFGGFIIDDMDDPDSYLSLSYEQFISPLIKAVQELSARVESLEKGL